MDSHDSLSSLLRLYGFCNFFHYFVTFTKLTKGIAVLPEALKIKKCCARIGPTVHRLSAYDLYFLADGKILVQANPGHC